MSSSSAVALRGHTLKTGMTLAIIGCGNMGSAILSKLLKSCAKAKGAGEEPVFSKFIATVNSEASASSLSARFEKDVEVLRDNLKAMKAADVIILGFKPYMIKLVFESIQERPSIQASLKDKLVISVLVGSPISKFQKAIFGTTDQAVCNIWFQRAMPNPAAELGEASTIVEITNMPKELQNITNWIFEQCGKVFPVSPELYDIGGVTAGVSIALLTVAFDGILDGAVSQGLKRSDAKKMLTQSLLAMAKLLENDHPAVLRETFSSPKGTTIDGIMSLEEDRVRWAFGKAVIASSKRSKEIGQ